MAQWLACWAHNPKVPGWKPGSAMHALIRTGQSPATQPTPHSPASAGTYAIFTAMSGGKKAQTTREEGAERGKQEKERRTEEKKEPN